MELMLWLGLALLAILALCISVLLWIAHEAMGDDPLDDIGLPQPHPDKDGP